MQGLLDGEAQALTRKALELALEGDTSALRMCLDRIGPPRRERVAPLKLPPVRDAADLAGTMTAIIAAAGEGAISPNEGGRLARLVEIFLRAVEVRDFERRLQLLENQPLPSYSTPALGGEVGLTGSARRRLAMRRCADRQARHSRGRAGR